MKQQRKLQDETAGMFAGPRGRVGQYLPGNIDKTSDHVLPGTTYGGQGLGWYWDGYPAVVSGLDLPDGVTRTGSNTDAVMDIINNSQFAKDAGMEGSPTGAPSVAGNFSS